MKPEEVEIKLAISGAAAARKLIRRTGFMVAKPRVFEENVVLDTPDRSLRGRGFLLRVRRAGKIVTCTFKGREVPGRHKRREEREFHSNEFERTLALFQALGYGQAFRYEKYRTEFARADQPGHITLDETPIGAFLELEGPGRWIDRAAKELGFTRRDYILASYGGLYARWREEHRSASPDMVF